MRGRFVMTFLLLVTIFLAIPERLTIDACCVNSGTDLGANLGCQAIAFPVMCTGAEVCETWTCGESGCYEGLRRICKLTGTACQGTTPCLGRRCAEQ